MTGLCCREMEAGLFEIMVGRAKKCLWGIWLCSGLALCVWNAEGYAREQAQEAGAETIAVPGWAHAWYAADADPYGGQLLVLQDGKDVWCIGYDGGQRLTDALDVFART